MSTLLYVEPIPVSDYVARLMGALGLPVVLLVVSLLVILWSLAYVTLSVLRLRGRLQSVRQLPEQEVLRHG